ncbi:hypothetical protein FJZ40_04920 [Candidatus Shapirobacteria bacterium]|nr:hypothetical protein [Candidatus Shapirobacteria bacterium]
MSYVASGVAGASPIWNKIISFALKDKKSVWSITPEGVVGASVCQNSGFSPGDSNCPTRYEYFLEGTLPPTSPNPPRSQILINKTSGQPIQPGEIPNNQPLPEWVEYQEHAALIDPLGTVFCLDCPPLPEGIKPSAAIIKYPFSHSSP